MLCSSNSHDAGVEISSVEMGRLFRGRGLIKRSAGFVGPDMSLVSSQYYFII